MKSTRRDFIKANAVATAAAAAGISSAAGATNLITTDNRLQWEKAPGRFCGTGCSVNVATRDNRVVATHGDDAARRTAGHHQRRPEEGAHAKSGFPRVDDRGAPRPRLDIR